MHYKQGVKFMPPRIDGFGPPHKGIRYLMSQMMFKVGNLNYEDDSKTKQLDIELKDLWKMLKFHAKAEEEFIFPHIEKADNNLFNSLREAHKNFESDIDTIDTKYEELLNVEVGKGIRIQKGVEFVKNYNDFVAHYFLHLQDEELLAMPLLWNVLSDEQILDFSQKIPASAPPEINAYFLPFFIGATNLYERIGILNGLRTIMPEEAFQGVSKRVEAILDSDDWEQLKTKVG
jgi:hemerythrin-like domain-containing protein